MVGLRPRVLYWIGRLHDLWIVLAWVGIVTGIMLNGFFHRGCYEYFAERDFTNPCQSFVDLGLIFAAAVGAGMTLIDVRVAVIGFIIVHVVSSAFFFIAILLPALSVQTDPVLVQTLTNRSVVLTFREEFPFPVFFSLAGSGVGLYFGGKVDSFRRA